MLKIGDRLPSFKLPTSGGLTLSSASLKGRKLIFYFYPKDSTPGCTLESQDFRDQYKTFQKLDADIYGISRDSVKSHDNFCAKQNLPFPLISDAEELLCQAFGVIKEKNMYGRKVMGIERSTFVFDEKSKLVLEWRGVKVKTHVEQVLTAVQTL